MQCHYLAPMQRFYQHSFPVIPPPLPLYSSNMWRSHSCSYQATCWFSKFAFWLAVSHTRHIHVLFKISCLWSYEGSSYVHVVISLISDNWKIKQSAHTSWQHCMHMKVGLLKAGLIMIVQRVLLSPRKQLFSRLSTRQLLSGALWKHLVSGFKAKAITRKYRPASCPSPDCVAACVKGLCFWNPLVITLKNVFPKMFVPRHNNPVL